MFQVYAIGQALIPVLPPPLPFQNAPTINQTNYEIGQLVFTPPQAPTAFYLYAGAGNWVQFANSSGAILAIAGTANQIAASTSAGTATLSLPSALIAPGTIAATSGFVGQSSNTAPTAGNIGEQIRSAVPFASAVTSTTTTVTNVTSISLTAGIWEISGIVMYTGMTTATFQQASIGTTSATIGTVGDNAIQSTFVSTTAGDFGVSIPAWRLALSTTTTVYLVGQGTYSAGTGKLYGRISATRVA